ncbi:BnaC03g72770D [Brassica napus]|uniref:Structural maintenance of chromosomes protein n=1 Tax=Brassica napus TaxID=3708 RepID=A0A078JF49_BRANA|nr:BnaC03g72770D [Brassica napus]
MYIKLVPFPPSKIVIIEGFKSYNEQTATEDFSSKVNCVVGANGSGKSNFFHAIRFVLSDFFQNLRNEDRNALLHEGVGHQVGSAFVEIVFDNSDNRIPVDKDEIRLRRAIGLKKDEYFLDGKHITKNEVVDLLESAGFSRSNPYYVVQQGKIASLTMMKDSERLDLLKEIGGTRVYEEKRCESLKIMQDTGNRMTCLTGIKRNHIIQAVQYLDEKLRELDEEKEELRKYQQLDKQRKSLEYTIYEKQLHDTREKLEQTEAERTKASEESTKMYDRVEKAQDECRSLDESLAGLTKELQTMNNKKETVEALKTEAIKKKTKLELDENDLKERIAGNIQSKNDALEQLSMVEREREDSLKELEAITPLYESQVDKEKQTTKRIMELEKKLNILYQKKGRATQFSDKATRDEWLRKETKYLKRVLDSNMGQEQKLQDEIFGLNTDLKERDAHIKNHEVEISELDTHISKSHEQFNIKKRERDEEHRKRREKWGEESQLSSEIDKLKMELERAKKNLDHATPGDVRRGLISIKRICSEHKINGVFGPLVELVDCDENLFHVVVENDDISTKIIEHLNSRKGGRVTFIPLNRVNAPHVNYPQCSDAIPLLRRLKFDSKFAPAFGQVFGRTVVCQDLNVATRVAKSDGLDCITLEGDQVSRKGGMTGGFYDHRRSKLRLMNTIIQNMKSIDTKEKVLEDVRRQLQDILSIIYFDQQITQIVTEKQRLESDWTHSRLQVEQLKQEIANETKQKHAIHIALEHKEKSLGDVRIQMEQLRSSMAMKEAEMATELVDHLTPEETEELSRLNPEIEDLKDKLIAFKTDRIETETRKAELETNLSTNLKRRIDELHATIASVDDYSLPSSAGLETQELDDAKLLVEEFTNELQGLCRSIDEKTKQVKKIKDKKAKLKTLQDDCEMKVQDANKKLEELFSLRNTLLSKQEEYRKKIMGLGPFSSESFDMYKQKSIKELQKVLHGCSEQLQQFSHVNKKALDQYVNFTEQREELQKRKTELDAGDEKIKELITVLDQQKDESIERTYKMVSFHFREIFSQLVQVYIVKWVTKIMWTLHVLCASQDRDHDDEDGCGEAATERRVEKYDGITVKVSFNDQGETRSMKQLSGGQKTVVALALIFAIQKCDPAPFYLFDEIDAALDTQYRTAVGNMIRGLADDSVSTQFITTTFRPELVKIADKMYGVFHENNASIVKVISKEQALNFIQNDQSP